MRRVIVVALALVLAAGVGFFVAGRSERGPSLETIRATTTTAAATVESADSTYPLDGPPESSEDATASSAAASTRSSTSTSRSSSTTGRGTRPTTSPPPTLGEPGGDGATSTAAPTRVTDITLVMGRCTLVSGQWRCPGTATFRLTGGVSATVDWSVFGDLEYDCTETEPFNRPQPSFTAATGQTSVERDLVLAFPEARQPNGEGDAVDPSVASARSGTATSRPVAFTSTNGCTQSP